jgi:hypothetical protein
MFSSGQNGLILSMLLMGTTLEWPYSLHKILMGFRPNSGTPQFILQSILLGACALPVSGERWFKKGKFPTELCNKFLVSEHQNPDWSQGISIMWIKDEWWGILTAVQRYITGEGHFSIVHCYHLCFLMHLSGDKELNLPFYFLKILKMSRRVQSHPESAHRSLYHQGFIKILVLFALDEIEMPWKFFLGFRK